MGREKKMWGHERVFFKRLDIHRDDPVEREKFMMQRKLGEEVSGVRVTLERGDGVWYTCERLAIERRINSSPTEAGRNHKGTTPDNKGG